MQQLIATVRDPTSIETRPPFALAGITIKWLGGGNAQNLIFWLFGVTGYLQSTLHWYFHPSSHQSKEKPCFNSNRFESPHASNHVFMWSDYLMKTGVFLIACRHFWLWVTFKHCIKLNNKQNSTIFICLSSPRRVTETCSLCSPGFYFKHLEHSLRTQGRCCPLHVSSWYHSLSPQETQ